MNNVSQKVHKFKYIQKEGTDTKSVVLLICFLFFVIQLFFSIRTSPVVRGMRVKLNVTDEQTISIIGFKSSYNTFDPDRLYSFNSTEHSHLAPFFFKPIPINYCNKNLLMSVKGIGPSLAERILKTRINKGSFESPSDLLEIKGIGAARLERFTPYLTFARDNAQ